MTSSVHDMHCTGTPTVDLPVPEIESASLAAGLIAIANRPAASPPPHCGSATAHAQNPQQTPLLAAGPTIVFTQPVVSVPSYCRSNDDCEPTRSKRPPHYWFHANGTHNRSRRPAIIGKRYAYEPNAYLTHTTEPPECVSGSCVRQMSIQEPAPCL